MSHELFYTSAPRGLQPGSRGFCTVAMTQGLPGPVLEKLEQLSGYRALFPPHDPKAALNPVAHAHVRLTVGGRTIRVLSRVCAAGLDYTQRTNTFAHHVVLEPADLPPAGPAWLAARSGFLEAAWDGEVRLLPAGRTPPRGDAPPAPCRAWEEVTGDAGWAGVLVEAFLADPNRPAYLVFDPGLDPLPLLAEAIALLPPDKRWEVTFSTYFTGLPQGVACAWRCVVRGSAEAKNRPAGALVVPLSREAGAAPESEAVEAARNGEFVSAPVPLKPAIAVASRFQPTHPLAESARPGLVLGTGPSAPPVAVQPPWPTPMREKPRQASWVWGFAAGLLAGIVIPGSVIGGLWIAGAFKPEPAETHDENALARVQAKYEHHEKQLQDELSTLKTRMQKLTAQAAALEKQAKQAIADNEHAIARLWNELELLAMDRTLRVAAQPAKPRSQELTKQAPMPIPPPPKVTGHIQLPPVSQTEPQHWDLTQVLQGVPLPMPKLAVRGLRTIPEKNTSLVAQLDPSGWLVVSVKENNSSIALCEFRVENNLLRFRWGVDKRDIVDHYHAYIRSLILEISSPEASAHFIALRKPASRLHRSGPNLYKLSWEDQGEPKGELFLGATTVEYDRRDYPFDPVGKNTREFHTAPKRELSKFWLPKDIIPSLGDNLKGAWTITDLRVRLEGTAILVKPDCVPTIDAATSNAAPQAPWPQIIAAIEKKGPGITASLSTLSVYMVVDGIQVPVFDLGKATNKDSMPSSGKPLKPAATPPENRNPTPGKTTKVEAK